MKPSQRAAYFYGFSGAVSSTDVLLSRGTRKKKKNDHQCRTNDFLLSIKFCLEILALSYHNSKIGLIYIS